MPAMPGREGVWLEETPGCPCHRSWAKQGEDRAYDLTCSGILYEIPQALLQSLAQPGFYLDPKIPRLLRPLV